MPNQELQFEEVQSEIIGNVINGRVVLDETKLAEMAAQKPQTPDDKIKAEVAKPEDKPPVKAPVEPETPEKTQAEEPEDKTPRLNHNLN